MRYVEVEEVATLPDDTELFVWLERGKVTPDVKRKSALTTPSNPYKDDFKVRSKEATKYANITYWKSLNDTLCSRHARKQG
jgi:hypothetical protein